MENCTSILDNIVGMGAATLSLTDLYKLASKGSGFACENVIITQ
jgi:hypothetical protein